MKVYHGSYCVIKNPDISFSRECLDFGKGFYITSIKQQSVNWAKRFKLKGSKSYINKYDLLLDEIKTKYNVKIFTSYNLEWLEFILSCRNGSNIYRKYDLITGGIADDRVYNTIELYKDNLIDKGEALKRLKFYKPNNQICIINQEIIDKYLKYERSEEL